MADFLIEVPRIESEAKDKRVEEFVEPHPVELPLLCWKIYVYRSSKNEANGEEVFAVSTDGDAVPYEVPYSLWFSVLTTNNVAKYETLIVGLQLALSLRAQCVSYFDPHVIVNRV